MSDPTCTLRAARVEDRADLAELQAQPRHRWGTLALPFPSPDAVRRQLEARPPDEVDLVAVVVGKVVGRARLQPGKGRRAHAGYLTLGVHDRPSGRGVGGALPAALLDAANRLDLKRLELGVWADDAPAIALYRQHGFAIEGREVAYAHRDGRYVDRCAMARLRGLGGTPPDEGGMARDGPLAAARRSSAE